MNLPRFHDLKVEEDPEELIEGIQKITEIMGVTPDKSADGTTEKSGSDLVRTLKI